MVFQAANTRGSLDFEPPLRLVCAFAMMSVDHLSSYGPSPLGYPAHHTTFCSRSRC